MLKHIRRGFAAFTLSLILLCTALPCQAAAKGPTIFAAASLQTALDAIATSWTTATGKPAPVMVYASSATLAKQIAEGAPADIFISADLAWMDYLDHAKLIKPDTRRNLLGNDLILIEPAAANANLTIAPGFDLAGATGNGKIAVCAVASCPGGIYARQALEKLGVWAQVEPKLAQSDTIRNALTLVARGEAAFGIVYASDAKAEPRVKILGAFPDSTHDPVIYPLAVIATSINSDASGFVAYLSSPTANKIWTEQGFKILSQ